MAADAKMPKPYDVELVRHDPVWLEIVAEQSRRLHDAVGPALLQVHHIGSTAVPTIQAKPIVDLMPVVTRLEDVDAHQGDIESLGYQWWGELGIPGRRYCILTDPTTGRRIVQLHIFATDADNIAAHLAFRDYLRAHPDEARSYEAAKLKAQKEQPHDVNAYNDIKAKWMQPCIQRARRWYQGMRADE